MNALLSLSTGSLLALIVAALIVPQAVLTVWFCWVVRQRTRAFVARDGVRTESATVPAEVILCLRGCDPTLDDVFASLARQSHRSWRLRVVVDSVDDPAWPVAQAAVARLEADGRASWSCHTVDPLAVRPERGSLKCASLRQALLSLAPETRVVALIDADSVVHGDWLVTMVDECLQPGVGAVSGNRWYDPDRDTPAAVVRALWNAGAIVQMTAFGIPWGGSLAVRREAMEACGWTDVIESTLCEDTALAEPLARAGWQYRFVPALTAIDRDDDVAFGPLTRWISRQLLTARLHHPLWPLVATHGITTSLALAGMVGVAVAAWVMSRPEELAAVAGALAAYEACSVVMAVMIAASVRAATAVAGKHIRPLSLGRTLWWAAMIPAAQVVYAIATASALTTRSIEWRGVVYAVQPSKAGREVVIVQ